MFVTVVLTVLRNLLYFAGTAAIMAGVMSLGLWLTADVALWIQVGVLIFSMIAYGIVEALTSEDRPKKTSKVKDAGK